MADFGGHTRQRKDGRWERTVTLGSRPDGRRITKSFYGRTAAEANRKWRDWLTGGGSDADQQRRKATTLNDFATHWLTAILPNEVIGNTVKHYEWAASHVLPSLGEMSLGDIRPRHIDAVLRSKADAGFYDSSVEWLKSFLARCLDRAVFEELIDANPARALRRRPRGAARKVGRTLTPEQAEAMLAKLRTEPMGAFYTVQLGTGMRPGEVAGLCWDAIDFEAGTIEVRRFVRTDWQLGDDGKRHKVLVLVPDVKNHKPRTIKAAPFVLDVLRAHQKAQRTAGGVLRPLGELVFPGAKGQLVHPSHLGNRVFKRICREIGLPDPETWHPNELRHTFVSLMSERGVTPEKIADYVGHSPEIDKGVYRHAIRKVADLSGHIEEELG